MSKFLKIEIFNSHRNTPVFRWLREGNVALGVDVTQQFIDTKIPRDRENQYSIHIKLKNSRPNPNDDIVIFEREQQHGNVRKALEEFNVFIQTKYGYSTKEEIKHALS